MPEPTIFSERFKVASRYYTTGRPTYPELLSRRVAEVVGLSGRDSVLDLGTGPGFLAIDFAPLARSVTAVDPSPEMLAAAQENAARAGAQIRFVQGSSYDLGASWGRFKLVTIGRAFHWMDRGQTLRSLDALLGPGGAVALFGESYPDVPQNAWREEFQAAIDRYSAGDPARTQYRPAIKHETVLFDSAFDHLERIAVLEHRSTPVERFVDRALSFAATWEGRPGSREDDLAVEIRNVIAKHATRDGTVREVIEGTALLARRSRDLRARA